MKLSLLAALCSAGIALHLPFVFSFPPPAAVVPAMSRRTPTVIFHPPTGSCLLRGGLTDPLKLGPCTKSDNWSYTPQKLLIAKGTYYCIQAVRDGAPARLSINCSEEDSQWDLQKGVETEIATKPAGVGSPVLCLEVAEDGTAVTNPCSGGLSSQLFQFTPSTAVPAMPGY